MKAYLIQFDTLARELVVKGESSEAVTAAMTKALPKRSMAEWMIAYNLKARYLKQ